MLVLRTIVMDAQIVENGRVTPCPPLSKAQLDGDDPNQFVPFPVLAFPKGDNRWGWAWTDLANAGWAIECWLAFANSNQQHIEAARQVCRSALDKAFVDSTLTLKDKVS
jgi:hypothetical protein